MYAEVLDRLELYTKCADHIDPPQNHIDPPLDRLELYTKITDRLELYTKITDRLELYTFFFWTA